MFKPTKIEFGPVGRIATHREDLILWPFKAIKALSLKRYTQELSRLPSAPTNTPSVIATSWCMQEVMTNINQKARYANKTAVIVYQADDLNGPSGMNIPYRLIDRLQGGMAVRYHASVILLEGEGKSHVLKDRGLFLKPIVKAVFDEAPDMIGTVSYASLTNSED